MAIPTGGEAPSGLRDQLLGRIVRDPTVPAGRGDAGDVQEASGDVTVGANALAALYAATRNLTYQPLVLHGRATVNPASEPADRQGQYPWVVAGSILGLLLVMRARQRRHELAVYVLAG